MGFPTRHRWSTYVIPKCTMGWLKGRFFRFFWEKSTADRLKRYQLSPPVSVINIWWSAAMLITSTVEICVQQLGRVKQMVWLPYDAGLSAAADTLVGILKRIIVSPAVYPRAFFNFFTLTFREFLRSDHWLQTYCIFSGGVFLFWASLYIGLCRTCSC